VTKKNPKLSNHCSFCGGKRQSFVENDDRDTGSAYGYYVRCSCGARSAAGLSGKAEAAALWDGRSPFSLNQR